jgi:xeroderma pigmentosum group C-complementing protein
MRQGYRIKKGAQPMKMIKQRAVTINKRRAVEMVLAEQNSDGSGEGNVGGLMQGLYAKNQTELYIPPPVVDVGFSPSDNPSFRVLLLSVSPKLSEFLGHHSKE